MIAKLIMLTAAVVGLFVGAHFLLYLSIVHSLAIVHPVARRAVLYGLQFLALSFPLAAILVKVRSNPFTEGCYILAALWLGLFLHLLVVVAVGGLLAGASRLVGWPLNLRYLAAACAAFAVTLTAYGMWSALHPRVHRIEVGLRGLPAQWRGRTIVHLSDLHLGRIHGVRFMERVVEKVNAQHPDVVVITGDLFDAMGGDFPSFTAAIDGLKAARGIFFVLGNHDTYNDEARIRAVIGQTQLRLLDGEVVDVDGLQFVGIGFPGLVGKEGQRVLERLRREISGEKPSILLFHTPTSIDQLGESRAEQHFSTYWFPDTACALNRELGIDLQLSGHTHAGQILPFGYLSALIYHGYDRGLHREGSFQLYTSTGTGTFGPPVRTAGRSEIVAITLRDLVGTE